MKTIRAWHHELGWTQFELAVRVGVRPQTVYFWESGRRTPRVAYVRKLGQLFGVNSDEIILDAPRVAPTESLQAPEPCSKPPRDEPATPESAVRGGSPRERKHAPDVRHAGADRG